MDQTSEQIPLTAFKLNVLPILCYIGSVAAPRRAVLRAAMVAQQKPFNALGASVLIKEKDLVVGLDVDGIRVIGQAARFRVGCPLNDPSNKTSTFVITCSLPSIPKHRKGNPPGCIPRCPVLR